MKPYRLPILLFALTTSIVAGFAISVVRADDPPAGKEALQGRWKLVTSNDAEIFGDKDMPNDVVLVIDGDNFMLTIANSGGTRELAGGISLDPMQTPQLIDFMIRGDNASTTVFGIYRLSGERLTIRWRTDDGRPGDFISPKAEFDATFVFKHEKT